MNTESQDQFSIYFDTFQCDNFNIPYFEDHKFSIAADAVLRSKSYDEKHTEYLTSMGEKTLHLERVRYTTSAKPWDNPGWYRVTSIE